MYPANLFKPVSPIKETLAKPTVNASLATQDDLKHLYKKMSDEPKDLFNIDQLDRESREKINELMKPLLSKNLSQKGLDNFTKIVSLQKKIRDAINNFNEDKKVSQELLEYIWNTDNIQPHLDFLKKYGLIWDFNLYNEPIQYLIPDIKSKLKRLDQKPQVIFELHESDTMLPFILLDIMAIMYSNHELTFPHSVDKNTFRSLIVDRRSDTQRIQFEQKGKYILMTLQLNEREKNDDDEREKWNNYAFETVFNAIKLALSKHSKIADVKAWIIDPTLLQDGEQDEDENGKISKMLLCNYKDLYKDELLQIALDLGLPAKQSTSRKELCNIIQKQLDKNDNHLYNFSDEMIQALSAYDKLKFYYDYRDFETLENLFGYAYLFLLQLIYTINPKMREYIKSNYYKVFDNMQLTTGRLNMIEWLKEKGSVPTLAQALKVPNIDSSFINWVTKNGNITISQKDFEEIMGKKGKGQIWIMENLDFIKNAQNKEIEALCEDLKSSHGKEDLLLLAQKMGMPATKSKSKKELCDMIRKELVAQNDLYKITKEMQEAFSRYKDLKFFNYYDEPNHKVDEILQNIFETNDLPLLQLMYILNPKAREYIKSNYYKGFERPNFDRDQTINLPEWEKIINWLIEEGAAPPTLGQALMSISRYLFVTPDYSFVDWVLKTYGAKISQEEVNEGYNNSNRAKWLIKNNFTVDQEGFDNLTDIDSIKYFEKKGMKFSPKVIGKMRGYKPPKDIKKKIKNTLF